MRASPAADGEEISIKHFDAGKNCSSRAFTGSLVAGGLEVGAGVGVREADSGGRLQEQ